MALCGDDRDRVSSDKVIKVLEEAGADLKVKYQETAHGGLAINVTAC
jgi:L-serine dehydratase